MTLEVNYNRPMDGSKIVRNGGNAFTVTSQDGEELFKYEADHEMNIIEIRNKAEEMYNEMKQNKSEKSESPEQPLAQAEPKGFFARLWDSITSLFD